VEIDRLIAWSTRRILRFRGGGLCLPVVEKLRHHYAAYYHQKPTRWVVLNDFRAHLRLAVDRSTYIGSMIYWRGYHHARELTLLEKILSPDMVFIDIGANIGEFAIVAASRLRAGTVYAFEPLDEAYRLLCKSVTLNGLENIVAFPFGLSDHTATADLYTSSDFALHKSFPTELATVYPTSTRSLKIGTAELKILDDVFPQLGQNRLDVIKIDIEGAELPALQGAEHLLRNYKPMLLVEVSDVTSAAAGYRSEEMGDYLASLGYDFYEIGENAELKKSDGGKLPYFGNILCR
jgi:FkbM family methyltransferase